MQLSCSPSSESTVPTFSNSELAQLFLLQFAFVLIVCRAVGWIAARVGQPQVIAEMIAGILLGPSLLGTAFPDLQAVIFPRQSMPVLYVVSQLGLVLYMFTIGAEMELAVLRSRLRTAVSVAVAGTVVPFLFAALLTIWLLRSGGYFGSDVTMWQAMLYLGAAMAITAFPVLARIIQERGIAGTAVGSVALGAGASGDVAAWCLLAAVLASLNDDPAIVVRAVGGGVLYVLVVFFALKPLLARIGARVEKTGSLDGGTLAIVLLAVASCGWFTESIGIHAVFGAFVFGAALPRGVFAIELIRTIQPLTTHVILPLFFVYSGLNTQIGLLSSASAWAVTGGIILVASAGKIGACWAAARATGFGGREAFAIGALMNARGLMELIVLNIGLERGLITPTLFTMMVMMAIVTTVAAGPLFGFAQGLARRASGVLQEQARRGDI